MFGEDPTVNKLQEKAAKLFGKEAGLFVSSGTMANLLAVMVHCNGRGYEMILGDESHIFKYENGSEILYIQFIRRPLIFSVKF